MSFKQLSQPDHLEHVGNILPQRVIILSILITLQRQALSRAGKGAGGWNRNLHPVTVPDHYKPLFPSLFPRIHPPAISRDHPSFKFPLTPNAT